MYILIMSAVVISETANIITLITNKERPFVLSNCSLGLHRRDVKIAAVISSRPGYTPWPMGADTGATGSNLRRYWRSRCVSPTFCYTATYQRISEAHSTINADTRDVFPAGAFIDLAVFSLASPSTRQGIQCSHVFSSRNRAFDFGNKQPKTQLLLHIQRLPQCSKIISGKEVAK
ncbi:hypothetical protein PoB_004194500 [Plakobranchus ocellatus]|uniref:Uncharacterized protein n=1 Tax=Plakobranchus ocellatus TaxID=259542 RepID=A0AAV4B7B8_9GAST|nr:hypothetical protein PoB_004194500 [Plakobranchus ocellatus]